MEPLHWGSPMTEHALDKELFQEINTFPSAQFFRVIPLFSQTHITKKWELHYSNAVQAHERLIAKTRVVSGCTVLSTAGPVHRAAPYLLLEKIGRKPRDMVKRNILSLVLSFWPYEQSVSCAPGYWGCFSPGAPSNLTSCCNRGRSRTAELGFLFCPTPTYLLLAEVNFWQIQYPSTV